MLRRPIFLLPALLGALALPAGPALAGEDDGDSGDAKLRLAHDCVSGGKVKAVVSGDEIDRVAFYVDGNRVKLLTEPNSGDRYVFSMKCARLSVGPHRASAVVTSTEGSRQALRFGITRVAQVSPRYTG
jgi:hypothetical protein